MIHLISIMKKTYHHYHFLHNNIVSSEHKNTDILNSPPKLNKIIDLSGMFSFCVSLEFLPDLSIWNISKVKEMNYIFFDCNSLKSLPDTVYEKYIGQIINEKIKFFINDQYIP